MTPDFSSRAQQPLAIVGYACRLSGGVESPDDLWELCTRRRSGWSEIPKDRFDQNAFHHPNASKTGCLNPIGGYFLQNDITRFDASFFNITAQEAISMDPQQRLLLETTFEALESAGTPKESLAGKNVGVFIGGNFADYEVNNVRDVDTIPMYQATGCAPSLLSGRISYCFDFRGPSMTFDTACSSSLVALHSAVQSVRSGESSAAVVAGARINLLPDFFVTMSLSQLFNDTGRVCAFDDRSQSGFGRGEGVGCVIIKPLDAALRDGDSIRALIAGSGVNQDGKTQGITNPNGDAQEELIRQVYANNSIDPTLCGFAEMHGTGTKVGDPIEAKAVNRALTESSRSARDPLLIGSVKSNVGHLEGASGIISVIKSAMMLEKGMALPNANYENPNPNIPMDDFHMKVLKSTRPFPRGKRFVSVSNYGFGGTNAHAVLEKAPLRQWKALAATVSAPNGTDTPWKLFALSANSQESLETRMREIGIYLEQRPEVFEKFLSANIAYTLGQRRSHLAYRVAIPARSSDELGMALATAKPTSYRAVDAPRLAFIFTGQGAQWARMGHELMEDQPVFRKTLEEVDEALKSFGADFSIVEELAKDASESKVNLAHISQPACSAVQIGLTNLLRSWGITPSSVTGHSSGEIGSAYAAGVLSLTDAMAAAYYRGKATLVLKEKHPNVAGGMIAVGCGREDAAAHIKKLSGYATVACVNSPTSVTISGDKTAVLELEKNLNAENIFNRVLKVDMGYHSKLMGLVADEYMAEIKHIVPASTSNVTFYSSLLGRVAQPSELGPQYWVDNLTNPVLFDDAVACMAKADPEVRPNLMVEVGPHSALQGPIKDILKNVGQSASRINYVPTLLRGKHATENLLATAGALYMRGVTADFKTLNFPVTGSAYCQLITDLPKYPWNHATKYWHESRIAQKHIQRGSKRNDVVGVLASYSNDIEPTWRNIVRLDDIPWLRHHKMSGMNVFPLAGYLGMAIEAAFQRAQTRGVTFDKLDIREAVVSSALPLNEGQDTEMLITLRPLSDATRGYSDNWDEFRVCSWKHGQGWLEHCRGMVGAVNSAKTEVGFDAEGDVARNAAALKSRISDIVNHSTEAVDSPQLYTTLTEIGAEYGATFQGLEKARGSWTAASGEIVVPDTAALMPKAHEPKLVVHPAFLDIFLQIVWPILGAGRPDSLSTLYMPTYVKRITVDRDLGLVPGDRLKVYGQCETFVNREAPQPTNFSMFATPFDSADNIMIMFDNLTMTPVRSGDISGNIDAREVCYKQTWQPLQSAVELEGVAADGEAKPAQANGDAHANGHANGEGAVGVATPALDIEAPIVVVSTTPGQQTLAQNVANAIGERTATKPSVGSLTDDLAGKLVIVIATGGFDMQHLSADMFATIKSLFLKASSLLWVYRDDPASDATPEANMVPGLIRSIRSETSAKLVALGLAANAGITEISLSEAIFDTLRAAWASDSANKNDREFRVDGGKVLVPRYEHDENMNTFMAQQINEFVPYKQPFNQGERRLKMVVGSPGVLDTIHFVDEAPRELGPMEIEVRVKATGMNFKDVVVAMGQLFQPYIGVECSGIVTSVGSQVTDLKPGQSVMAMSHGAYSTFARCPGTSAAVLPNNLTFETACTIPVVFCTAYYGLFDLARLQAGERILIHAAAGGVGQAAIMLAKHIGAEIFATVGSNEKKKFLMDTYSIPENRIFFSRNTSFAKGIRDATHGEGVDVVLNSLAGDILRETWDCLAPFGRFIEIGKADITRNSKLEMNKFEYNCMFASVDLTKVADKRPLLMKRIMNDVTDLLAKGIIQPIAPVKTYGINEVETAIRIMQSGKNTGKIVVAPREGDEVMALPPRDTKKLFNDHGSYLLVGGTGGLGRSMARWMAKHGARYIVLLSRSGAVQGPVETLVGDLAALGTTVEVHSCDVSKRESVNELIQTKLKNAPPVRGVIHGAMVLRDMLFENMTHDDYTQVVESKVSGAWNLHHALADAPLDFFIALSSVAGIVGNRGQANYAAANVFLDNFMKFRNANGLPGTSIDLTAVSDAGYLADAGAGRTDEILKNLGSDTIDEAEVLALISGAVQGRMVESCGNHSITGLFIGPKTMDAYWTHDPRFSVIKDEAAAKDPASGAAGGTISIPQLLKTATTAADVLPTLHDALLNKIAALLMIPAADIDPSVSVGSLGLDSLVGIEVRNWIAREADANVQVLELLTSASIMALAETVVAKSKLVTFGK